MKRRTLEHAMWVVWPGFLTAIAAEIVFFTIFDPLAFDLNSRETVYSAAFLAFWVLGMVSSALTLFLQRPQDESPPS
ncbi:MAG TPA: hypothetical protein VJV77_02945 [Casimicrobiaceae bacterium]|nr:hypothetical protein [Casimicrobiaceae bacterium]